MTLVDVNLLLCTVNPDFPQHEVARTWFDAQLTGVRPVGLPWAVLLGFMRLSTRRRMFEHPLAVAEAIEYVDKWLAQPAAWIPEPRPGHWTLVANLLRAAGTAGNLTTDAHLAALAIQHDALLCSTDTDFGRFAGLRWHNPLAA